MNRKNNILLVKNYIDMAKLYVCVLTKNICDAIYMYSDLFNIRVR